MPGRGAGPKGWCAQGCEGSGPGKHPPDGSGEILPPPAQNPLLSSSPITTCLLTHALPQPGLLAFPNHLRVKPDSRPSRYPSHPQPRGTHARVLEKPLLRRLVLCWPPAAQAPPNRSGSAATVTLSNHTSDGASPAPDPPTIRPPGPVLFCFLYFPWASLPLLSASATTLCAVLPLGLCMCCLDLICPFPPLHFVSTAHPSAGSTGTISSGFAEWFDQCLPLLLDQVRGAVVVSTFAPPFICGTVLGLIQC